jgi:hypothetical protein
MSGDVLVSGEVLEPTIIPEGEIEIGVLLVQDLEALGVDRKLADEILRKGMVIGYKAGYSRGHSDGHEKALAMAAKLSPSHEKIYTEGWEAALLHSEMRLRLEGAKGSSAASEPEQLEKR